MALTTDPNDPRLGKGVDTQTRPQNEAYLVLSDEERAKGFVRPVRHSYKHVGLSPNHPLRDLTVREKGLYGNHFAKFEVYPENDDHVEGRFWTQDELDNKCCGAVTTMAQAIAETYALSPRFYSATYCTHCQKHLPVSEFIWIDDGTVVGS